LTDASRWNFFTVVILSLGVVWIWMSKVPHSELKDAAKTAPQTGFLAPDFSLATPKGEQIKLSDQRGKAVIVNIWASWCLPCREEMPVLQRIYEESASQGLLILAVNATNQDDPEEAIKFSEDLGLSFPILLDIDGSVSSRYRLQSLPTTFFIDPGGKIDEVVLGGPMAEALLRVRVERLLKDAKP